MTAETTGDLSSPEQAESASPSPDLETQRLAIVQRLTDLVARIPAVRKDAQALHARVGPIETARLACGQFVRGEHQPLQQLVYVAQQSSQEQAVAIAQLSSDLHRSVEIAALFIAARAESWLRFETIAVAPAGEWTAVAQSQGSEFEQGFQSLREWTTLKRPRWLPETS